MSEPRDCGRLNDQAMIYMLNGWVRDIGGGDPTFEPISEKADCLNTGYMYVDEGKQCGTGELEIVLPVNARWKMRTFREGAGGTEGAVGDQNNANR